MNYILPYQTYRFVIVAQEELLLPYYKGSTIRGGFGNAFRRVVCTLRNKECRDCILNSRCIYAYIFETAPQEGASIMGMNKYENIPHPFVIEPPSEGQRIYKSWEQVSFGLVLIGRANDYLPYFIYTFDELGKIGIGKRRGKYTLLSVKKADGGGALVYSSDDRTIRSIPPDEIIIPAESHAGGEKSTLLTLKFLSPTRISYQRQLTTDLKFEILTKNIVRRFNLLRFFHWDGKSAPLEHREIIAEAERVAVKENSLRWWDWERYSSRQHTRMKMGGFVGEITYEGNIEPFIPLLRAGEVLHVGKGTSFGLGKYKIEHNI